MEKGREFLRAQINNAITQHRTLIDSLESHSKQAEDRRFKELCDRYATQTRRQQSDLEEYGKSIGAEGASGIKGMIGSALGKAKDTVDAMRQTDFLRVVEDIVLIRQAQDTFATFAAVGAKIGEPRLAEIGKHSEREHDDMQRDFNSLIRELFVTHVQATGATTAEGAGLRP